MEDPERRFSIERSDGGTLTLFDDRNLLQHYWFVLRADLLPGRAAGAAEVLLIPSSSIQSKLR